MKILIDIMHPAHVHVFRNFYFEMKKRGHEILVTARNKEMTTYLLKKYDIPYIKISSIGNSKVQLLKEFFVRSWNLYKIIRKFKPDVMIGLMGIIIAPLGRLLRIPTIVLYDTENAKLTNFTAYRLCTRFVTPDCYKKRLGKKNIRYAGYHELTYLHPRYFSPDPLVLKKLELSEDDTIHDRQVCLMGC